MKMIGVTHVMSFVFIERSQSITFIVFSFVFICQIDGSALGGVEGLWSISTFLWIMLLFF